MTAFRSLSFTAALLACSGASAAWASSATAAAELAEAGEAIVVTGQRSGYGINSTSTATRTNTDIRNIPQALTVISESQIEDQGLRSIADVLNFVPGATPGTGEGNRDQITLRGNNTTADFFVDGIRDDVQYFRDLYNIDRVEVLRGSNAMIFGRGGGGGVVNRVTKRSGLSEHREFLAAGDGKGGVRFAGDFDQPLGSGAGLRINGMYENGDSFRRHVGLERYAVNPTVALLAGPDTRIDLSYEYLHDRRTADRGVPSDAGKPLRGHDRTFFGDPDSSFAKAGVQIATFGIEHKLGDGLKLRNRTLYGDYDKFYQNIYPNSSVLPADSSNPEPGVRLAAYNLRNDRNNLISQTNLIWENRLGGIDQTLLFGIELGRQQSRNRRVNGTIVVGGRVPLSDPTVDVDVVYAPIPSGDNNRTRATVAAAYIQNQIRVSPKFEIVAGLRFDSFKLTVDDLRPHVSSELGRHDELWSPRLGLILKPRPNLSLYASYSRSYLPSGGDQFSSLDLTSKALKPEKFDNYELGAKWEPLDGLLATAAVYQLDRTNTRATDPANPQRIVLTGAQRSRGIELGLERSVSHRWQISAGYAFQKATVTEPTQACPSGTCVVPLVPRHSFSLWNRYDVSDKLGLGLGVIARSKSYASIGNAVTLPSYERVDTALFYKLTRGVEAQVNVENLFGADYFPTAHNDNNIAPGASRTVKASLRFGL